MRRDPRFSMRRDPRSGRSPCASYRFPKIKGEEPLCFLQVPQNKKGGALMLPTVAKKEKRRRQ